MIIYASRAAIARASDADHSVYSPMRAHLYITSDGRITYRSIT